ncbi:MAG TPA: hypothetical protein PLD62_09570 [Candidatus Cloacimonadota bacterium]|nr:hypothetical protein [Candidatus Cloacimonadota bacterium]
MNSNLLIQKEKGQVVKICQTPRMFQKELYIYSKNLPFVPKLLDHDNKNTLVLEYIDGIPISDLAEPDFGKIAEIFLFLHNIEQKDNKCICHFNNHPRNFLYADHQYYLLDFSEWRYDFPETDLIHFLLYWASLYRRGKFNIAFRSLMSRYLKQGVINPLEWEMQLSQVIERFDAGRQQFGKWEDSSDVNSNREMMKNIYV